VPFVFDLSSFVFLTNFLVSKSGRGSGCGGGRIALSGWSTLSSGVPVDFDELFDVLLVDPLPFLDLVNLISLVELVVLVEFF